MSKAEDRALETYPKDIEEYVDVNGMKSVVDNNSWQRTIFLKGYHQAEKDNELTWEDIETIQEMANKYCNLHSCEPRFFVYKEVLKRFKAQKRKQLHKPFKSI